MLTSSTMRTVQQIVFEETGTLATPTALVRNLVSDSLEMASLIQALEAETGKDISDEDAQKMITVQDVVDYLEKE